MMTPQLTASQVALAHGLTGRKILSMALAERYGFLSKADVQIVAADPNTRLSGLLIRFEQGRCTAPAQDVEGLIAAAERGGWSCRDVSVPANAAV